MLWTEQTFQGHFCKPEAFHVSDHAWFPNSPVLSVVCRLSIGIFPQQQGSPSFPTPWPLSSVRSPHGLRLLCASQVRLVEAWVQGKDLACCLMASLRRVKVLLVLNLIAVAGFVIFLAKCRPIAVRSGDAFHEIRPRAEVANLSTHSASPIQDAVLKRLSLLEDIVYRQLNGKDVRGRP